LQREESRTFALMEEMAMFTAAPLASERS